MADLYRPDNSILVVAGDIDLAATRAAVHDSAARLGWGGPGAAPARPNPAGPNGKSESINTGVSAVVAGQNSSDHNIVGLGWPKPAPGDKDQLAMLVVDQILLGGRDDPSNLRRSDASPLGRRLASAVGGKDFWDRIDDLATPPLADPGAALQVVLFNTKHDLGPAETRRAVRQALLDIRKRELGDTMIETARDKLAAYYDRWLVEPRHRTLAEHLMAYQVTGRSPSEVKQIPSGIRRVRPVEVRRAFERRLLAVEPLVVVLPRIATPQRPQG
jgi:predicted Zn-dependent peptidase